MDAVTAKEKKAIHPSQMVHPLLHEKYKMRKNSRPPFIQSERLEVQILVSDWLGEGKSMRSAGLADIVGRLFDRCQFIRRAASGREDRQQSGVRFTRRASVGISHAADYQANKEGVACIHGDLWIDSLTVATYKISWVPVEVIMYLC